MLSLKLLFFQKKFGYPAFFQTRNIPTTFSSKLMRGRPLAICARQRKKVRASASWKYRLPWCNILYLSEEGMLLGGFKRSSGSWLGTTNTKRHWHRHTESGQGTVGMEIHTHMHLHDPELELCLCLPSKWRSFLIPDSKGEDYYELNFKKNLAELYKQNYSI